MTTTIQTAKQIPSHLRPFVSQQKYNKYTPIDHAVWRYVMRQNHHFLDGVAHEAFVEGLNASGININEIPKVRDMNQHLSKIGWGAAIVDGLIPGTAFFDFQAHGILPIATDIRQKSNIEYTPAPDILHEAAGHAPILFNETYSTFVKTIGEIGSNAFATKEEHEAFEATRHLSIVMESSTSTEEEIQEAKQLVEVKQKAISGLSEAEQISRLFWWTVEFGLIGDVNAPTIFGAGLLSSVGESQHCLTDAVEKVPFSVEEASQTTYDVTSMQNKLFVAESFEQLIEEIEAFGNTMAFRTGGTNAIDQAVQSQQIAHIEYNSGLQVTGVFDDVLKDEHGEAIYVKTSGPTALSVNHQQLSHHGTDVHTDGFGAPIGILSDGTALETLTETELKQRGLAMGRTTQIDFASGISVTGHVSDLVFNEGQLILISLDECLVTHGENVLFDPTWGTFDLAVGSSILSAKPKAADHDSFFGTTPEVMEDDGVAEPLTHLEALFEQVRSIRDAEWSSEGAQQLQEIARTLQSDYQEEWLLRLEVLEILVAENTLPALQETLHEELQQLRTQDQYKRLIQNGLSAL